jgi:sugar phosphate isomerase/epimerase
MHIGVFARTFPRPTVEEALDAVAAHAITHVQFNMSCAGRPTLPPVYEPDLCRRIAGAFAARGLTMAAVSGTFNAVHPDLATREAGLEGLRVLIESCGPLGTSIVTLCTGTRDPADMWAPHPENATPEAWRDLVGTLREALKPAEDQGVTLAFEPELANVVDSAGKARRLLDEVGSPNLKVVLDPANLFPEGSLSRMDEVLDSAFDLIGPDVVLAHAKDLARDGEAGHQAAGTGRLDFDRYVGLLNRSGYGGALVLHGLEEHEVDASVAFLRSKLGRGTPPTHAHI